jgi:putative IMPACT (imprinted ancient) family translation regulator
MDENGNEIEDYDDDGEHEAGFKLLGIVQKMKIINLFVMVTRWYGGTLLHQDRFKRINDCAQILLNQHPDVFESNNK